MLKKMLVPVSVMATMFCASMVGAAPVTAVQKSIAKQINSQLPKYDAKVSASNVKTLYLNGAKGGFSVQTRTNPGAFPQLVTGDFAQKGSKTSVFNLKVTADGVPGRAY
jgi:hypothetical protein